MKEHGQKRGLSAAQGDGPGQQLGVAGSVRPGTTAEGGLSGEPQGLERR